MLKISSFLLLATAIPIYAMITMMIDGRKPPTKGIALREGANKLAYYKADNKSPASHCNIL